MSRPRPPLLTLTENAAAQVKSLLSQREKPALGVRVSLKTKGCSGLAYGMEYVDTARPEDESVSCFDVVVFIDPQATLFLVGTTMDYVDDPLAPGFQFINPNEKGRCGCGESFHV
jgi:iron-sulfur cluster assembly protein